MMMTEKFRTLESRINKPFTYFITGIIWLSIILILVVIGSVFNYIFRHWKDDTGIFIILVIAQILLISCCTALITSLTYRRKQKIRKVTIDEKGATFYNSRNQIVDTVLYSELQHSRSSSADIYLHNTQTVKYGKITLKVFLRDKTGEMILKTIDFSFEYVILSNTYDLYRHFLKGVQHFRPDLAIDRQTIEHYSLTTDDPPAGKWGAFEYIMAAFFLLVVLGVIYAFIVIIKTLF
ncbi:hypothetical protein [Chryseobacterium arthrosphaerae]|uniref:hypothetical protein n=1 Tax=Chryseobacterium arthrosphaerae TaxID=651561 RepID=UPI001E4230FE|nr:hypothetical protein [Chryseobacterium arthrosphaerae]UEQ76571.1 hypothetical protein J8N07_23690 [Chryseobacterium arthrosphaerae]